MRLIFSLFIVFFIAISPGTLFAQAHEPTRGVSYEHTRSRAHFPGLRYDYGMGGHALGLGYMYGIENYHRIWQFSLLMRTAAGVDARAITKDFDGLYGMMAMGTLRATFIGDTGGIGLEGAGGLALGADGTLPVISLGVYWSSKSFDIGYAYQFPPSSDRPSWLSSHQLSLRLHFPVGRQYDESSRRAIIDLESTSKK